LIPKPVYIWTARDEQTAGICSRTWRLVKRIFKSGDDDNEAREVSETEIAIRSMQVHYFFYNQYLDSTSQPISRIERVVDHSAVKLLHSSHHASLES
jgi:hypothetical protein